MKELPPLQWLRSFECAARHLSFTHAAAELSITQSAVSQQIKALENHLGHALFIRRARSLELTDAGFAYLPDIQSAITLLRRSTRAHFGDKDNAAVTIRSNFAFSSLWLLPRLNNFRAKHPGISIQIVPALWESDYRRQSTGIEIRFGTGDWTDNKKVLFDNLISYPVCAPDVAESANSGSTMADTPLIAVSGMMEQWSDFFSLVGISKKFPPPKLSTPSFNIALEMAALGMGMVLGHDIVCDRFIMDGRLVRRSTTGIEMQERYYMVYDDQEMSREEEIFTGWLIDVTREPLCVNH